MVFPYRSIRSFQARLFRRMIVHCALASASRIGLAHQVDGGARVRHMIFRLLDGHRRDSSCTSVTDELPCVASGGDDIDERRLRQRTSRR
jgi:hypothetical protein